MGESRSESKSVTKSTRRYWRRVDTPSGGWWPWGWLPLLGLLLTFLYGLFVTAPHMEDDTEQRVSHALAAANFVGYNVKADGQRVSVSGAGSESVVAQITAIARGAVCDTWIAKNVVCPTHVNVKLTAPPKAEPPKAVVAAPVSQPAPEPVARFHDFNVVRTKDAVRLRGEVPSSEFKTRLVRDARARFSGVVDELRVTNEQAGPDINWAATQSLAVLAEFNSGSTTWKNGIFSARGNVEAEKETSVRNLFGQTANAKLLGDLNLQILRTTNACNERFSAALTEATIQFRTSSAEISAQSEPLLKSLAQLAKECPFQLDVEGHTDSRGAPDMNQQLSFARAQAVVNALGVLGVDISRLTARGYGPDRPVADNQTREGRARNRRIEIKSSSND